jgi:hypothetical protein
MRSEKISTPHSASQRRLRIAPADWSYPDWSGFVYPPRRPKKLSGGHIPRPVFRHHRNQRRLLSTCPPDHAAWIDRVAANPSFMFTAKLWQRFTHEPSANVEDERNVRAGFDVLREAGNLSAVLLQFPFSFHKSPECSVHLSALLKRFTDYPLVVRLRHSSWQTQGTLDLLREHNAGLLQHRSTHHRKFRHANRTSHLTRGLGALSRPPPRHLVQRRPKAPRPRTLQLSLFSRRTQSLGHADPGSPEAHPRRLRGHQQPLPGQGRRQRPATAQHFERNKTESTRRSPHYPQLEEIASGMPAAPTLFPLGSPTGKKSKGTIS